MNFVYLSYLPVVLVLLVIIIYSYGRYEKKYFKWVEDYWFMKRTKISQLSSLFFIISIVFLGFALLDLRGPEEKIRADIPDQKTIIIIDSSASMLVEDVRPNRFSKSIVMARHFVKKAVGHKIAVVLFSDSQKRLVPFTDDVDLLDARISGLEKIGISNGGSNLSQAIKESVQYFKSEGGSIDSVSGNILVFTDSEEHVSNFDVSVPESVNVAVVGVGTLKGGPIPLRSNSGAFIGYKKYKGKKIVSKLNEGFLKGLATKIDNYKYWVAYSYTIPTEKIISFFRSIHKEKTGKGDIRIKPVLGKFLILPFIFFYIISVALRTRSTFILPLLMCVFVYGNTSLKAEEIKPKSPLQINIEQAISKMQEGSLTHAGILNLAGNLLAIKKYEKSLMLFDENINEWDTEQVKDLFNYATSLLANKKISNATEVFLYLDASRVDEMSDELKQAVKDNIAHAMKRKEDKKKKDKGKDKDKDKKKNDKKDKKDKKKGQEKDKKNNKDEKENQKGKDKENKDKKNKKPDGKDQKGDKSKEEKKENKDGADDDQKKQKKPKLSDDQKEKEESLKNKEKKKRAMTLEDKENEIKRKRKLQKIPAELKQLLNDDRNLQKKYMNTSTNNRDKDNKKDW